MSSNHVRAPKSAAFVKAMRETFGEVVVLYVEEGDLLLGEKQPEGAPCFVTAPLHERPRRKWK